MPLATMTPEGQLAIPKDVREAIGWKAGGYLTVDVVDGALVAKPQRKGPRAVDLIGLFAKSPLGGRLETDDVDDAIGTAISEHVLGQR
jgi:AbrB family looped-hinge helix DNA binding protein